MKVIKKINNNAAICIDSIGNELIAIGTGIGFHAVPYELENLDIIQRTYYGVNPMYLDLLNQISEDIFNVSANIVEMFRCKVNSSISSNLIFTLADHISFAIEREKNNIKIETPLHYDIQHLYELEYEVGIKAVKLIQKQLNIRLPRAEASNIALHLINAKSLDKASVRTSQFEELLEDILEIIRGHFKIYIDKNSINYSRFVSHFQYLMKREQKGEKISSENYKLYKSVLEEYPDTFKCVIKIKDYIEEELNFKLNEEELLYLSLHVNRLCVREDCNRKGITPAQECY